MARSMAARASSSSTPASSKRIRPGGTTATHSSGVPLPEPMRVSAGLWVTGLSGKTRIQTFPPRLTWRVMAIRAASIWRAVSHPGSIAWIPKSPNDTAAPPLAWPFRRPRCVLRCLTFLGINMSVRLLAEVRGLVVLVTVLPFHLFVLGQLTLEVVGLGRRHRQEVGHRGFLGVVDCVVGRVVGYGSLDDVHRDLDFPARGVQQELVEQVGVGSGTVGRRGVLARGTEVGLAPSSAGGDETAGGA